jgi:nucleotide-binding universal stress UspA family protein
MTRRVLVALDESEQAWDALEYALAEFEDAEVVALAVINPLEAGFSTEAALPGYSEEWYERAKADAEALLSEAQERAAEADVTLRTRVEHGRPVQCIVAHAEEQDVDHVVVGSHGRSGVSRILLGSVAEGVVRQSPVPVTVVR